MRDGAELKELITNAKRLHGHLGPFLVIGVRMGVAAKKALNVSDDEYTLLKAHVMVPLFPPFSCLLDGIQASTTCTVGNQRLKIENSGEIRVTFTKQGSSRTVKITVNARLAEELKGKLSEDKLTEEFAREIAGLRENQVLNIALV